MVLGMARQGKALAQFLSSRGAHVTMSDLKSPEALVEVREELAHLPLEYALGGHPSNLLEGTSMLFLSGGVPPDIPIVKEGLEHGIELSNDSQLFMELCPAPVIGITGSAGKSTTTALAGVIAEEEFRGSGRTVWTGGNLGRPLLLDLDSIQPDDWAVLELSSFQLELMNESPKVAAVLNITPNHLDRHKTMEAYTEAKARILRFQSADDIAVLGKDDPGAWAMKDLVHGKLLTFGMSNEGIESGAYVRNGSIWLRIEDREREVLAVDHIPIPGLHNVMNAVAACAIAAGAGFSIEAMQSGIPRFKGLPHRLEFVKSVAGVDWFNDSIATSPERAMAAMTAFDRPIVLLAGGRDKDLPWKDFIRMVQVRVDHLILFGEAAEKIQSKLNDLPQAEKPFSVDLCGGLEEAVEVAFRVAEPGDVVLLAPGGTSFDEFIDFAARGERFVELVEEL